ncbi:RNA polymerase sigma factor, sigma-70 family [Fodinibius roseus]|uniref:RNA polymerase sigma factor, sigma-70 family n=1 Tax=Fodinibius roseus TaxID=1194090 RepID=A0A1M5DTB6_9BACT|nr:sigma-70 family RNA polymerase sigma factor [Fodinibius roseus]SHF70243.1 RNA polymerase sigma factor, sigma-70 family [Fodinibius roseus]
MKKDHYAEDVRLWKRLLDDDREALSELFQKYYRPLLNYGLKLIPREELVKDSIQELFYSIWEQRSNLSDIEYVRSYLYISLRRTIYRQNEIKQKRNKREQSYSEESFRHVVNKEDLMMMEEFEREQKQELKRALETLNQREKETIFLKFYSGLSNAEIAEVMEVNRQSVYNYVHRAIQALKKFLNV